MERGKPVILYIFDKKNNRIEYIENGKFKYGIMMPENENDSYTFFRYDKNEKVNLVISIVYFYNNNLNALYPEISYDVFVDDNWSDEQIKSWYETKHFNVHHKGITVVQIIRK